MLRPQLLILPKTVTRLNHCFFVRATSEQKEVAMAAWVNKQMWYHGMLQNIYNGVTLFRSQAGQSRNVLDSTNCSQLEGSSLPWVNPQQPNCTDLRLEKTTD